MARILLEASTLNELNDALNYKNALIALIREKYSINDELAILRQRDSKPDEFNEYNLYVEHCKHVLKTNNK